jgi:hypothetical protein
MLGDTVKHSEEYLRVEAEDNFHNAASAASWRGVIHTIHLHSTDITYIVETLEEGELSGLRNSRKPWELTHT